MSADLFDDLDFGVDTDRPWGEIDDSLVARVREAVARGLSDQQATRGAQGLPRLSPADEEQLAERLINDELRRHARTQLDVGRQPLTEEAEGQVRKAVIDLMFRLARLQPYMERTDVVNLHAQGGQPVWLDLIDGRTVRGAPVAGNGDELIEFVRELGRRVGISERRFDPDHYRINLQLPDGSRLFAIAWVTRDPHLFIRRHHHLDIGLEDLPRSMSPMVAKFLTALVRAKQHVVIAGGQGDGKTTLLRAMAAAMDPAERIVTIETDFELALDRLAHRHHEVIAMEAREPNVEGVGQVTCAQLVRDAMRTSSRRVIVGEVLGDEVVPMLNAMNSGAKGSLCSLHADSSGEVFNKLATLAAQSPQHLPFEVTYALAAAAIDFIVFVHRDRHGHPVVASIREVAGFDGQRPLTNELFTPDIDGHAYPTGTPVTDRRAGLITAAGFDPRWLIGEGNRP